MEFFYIILFTRRLTAGASVPTFTVIFTTFAATNPDAV
jgi:hypothetical protein